MTPAQRECKSAIVKDAVHQSMKLKAVSLVSTWNVSLGLAEIVEKVTQQRSCHLSADLGGGGQAEEVSDGPP